MKCIQVMHDDQIAIVESLAREIWTEHYVSIIGREQVDYMLERFQTGQAVREQARAGVLYFLLRENDAYVGYMALQPRPPDELFLSKIYVRSTGRGRGYGKQAMDHAERIAREQGLRIIALTVNKNNAIAIKAYERMGFRNAGSLVQDIGGGFVMDDYRMEKDVKKR